MNNNLLWRLTWPFLHKYELATQNCGHCFYSGKFSEIQASLWAYTHQCIDMSTAIKWSTKKLSGRRRRYSTSHLSKHRRSWIFVLSKFILKLIVNSRSVCFCVRMPLCFPPVFTTAMESLQHSKYNVSSTQSKTFLWQAFNVWMLPDYTGFTTI